MTDIDLPWAMMWLQGGFIILASGAAKYGLDRWIAYHRRYNSD